MGKGEGEGEERGRKGVEWWVTEEPGELAGQRRALWLTTKEKEGGGEEGARRGGRKRRGEGNTRMRE